MWLIYALLAAILWGFNYTLTEKILSRLSPLTLLALETLVGALVFSALAYFTSLKKDLQILVQEPTIRWLTLTEIIVILIASYFIVASINAKNATAAGIVELIYPLFIILFTWWLFGELHINSAVILGGSLIFVGVLIISLS